MIEKHENHNNYGVIIFILIILAVLAMFVRDGRAGEIPFTDKNCIRAVIGEASNQGYHGMLSLAVGIRNRGTLHGVYGVNAKHVDNEPAWVWDMAVRAWEESEINRIHSGDHWGSTIVDKKWIETMKKNGFSIVYQYKDHVFCKKEATK